MSPEGLDPQEVVYGDTYKPRKRKKMSSWHRFTGRYIKSMYRVKMPDGSTALVWPNAGKLNLVDGSGRQFTVEDNVEIRIEKDWDK